MAPVELAEPVIVDKSTECHVTPPDVADRMVEYLDLSVTDRILEPQAGTGNLIDALMRAGADPSQVTAVERHVTLSGIVRDKFPSVSVFNECFLEYEERGELFSKIIMNPPFRQVKAHMKAAQSCLIEGGTIIALVPTTFQTQGLYEIEKLSPDVFASCKVSTKIIELQH
jgi:phospholipid N-methyltransferase